MSGLRRDLWFVGPRPLSRPILSIPIPTHFLPPKQQRSLLLVKTTFSLQKTRGDSGNSNSNPKSDDSDLTTTHSNGAEHWDRGGWWGEGGGDAGQE